MTLTDSDYESIRNVDVLQEAALILRAQVMNIKAKKLPENITVKNLLEGECEVPKDLSDFCATFLSGTRTHRQNTINKKRLVSSFCQDFIYAVTNGRIKTSKHITLAMALKSLTSSRKIINIINKFGHCCSYTTTEELETEATFNATSSSQICPDDIVRKPNLSTGVAFNNFDRFVDTLTGKDTLHDTVGIIFQNIVPDTTDDECSSEAEETSGSKKRRRTFDAITPNLDPYPKRPRLLQCLQPLSPEIYAEPSSLKIQQRINHIWMFSHALAIPKTPMWVGFNSKIFLDESMKQRISYLTTINQSPTNNAVVKETMVQSLKIAAECNDKYIQVTYDLAIAKIALQIQSQTDEFQNIFIHIGGFHVMMAFFKAIGKFIDACGISNIMIDTELIASGSVNGFLTGKHFNRCKRLHPTVSLAFSILHFRQFLKECNIEITEEMKSYITNYNNTKSAACMIEHQPLADIIIQYENYLKQTINGERGKTAQYYMIYVNLVNYYLLFNSSIRTADFNLFKYVLPKISNLFFALNQPNYARWLVRYHNNLCQVDETHPGLRELFEKGSFGIKRTEKDFSRQPIDLTLEQTINANAANKLTGVLHFTNSTAARQRWCKSHSIRSTIISYVVQQAGLSKNQDITADLEKSKMDKSTTQLNSFIGGIMRNVNPFDENIDKGKLFNISSGQAASIDIENFLLNVENSGNKFRENFIRECEEDINRFEKPIKRNKILTFIDTLKKKKLL